MAKWEIVYDYKSAENDWTCHLIKDGEKQMTGLQPECRLQLKDVIRPNDVFKNVDGVEFPYHAMILEFVQDYLFDHYHYAYEDVKRYLKGFPKE